MSLLVYWIPIIFMAIVGVWFFTCTEHSNVPLSVPVIIALLTFVPIFGIFMPILLVSFLYGIYIDNQYRLKKNRFNTVFFNLKETNNDE